MNQSSVHTAQPPGQYAYCPTEPGSMHTDQVFFLYLVCSLGFVEFKSLQPIRAITELRDVEYGGVSGPGRNGRRPGEPIPVWPG